MQRRKEADHNKKKLPCKMPSLEWFLADAKYMYRRTGVRCKICVQAYKPIWMYPKPSKLHPFTCTPIESYYLIPLPTWWDGSVAVRWLYRRDPSTCYLSHTHPTLSCFPTTRPLGSWLWGCERDAS